MEEVSMSVPTSTREPDSLQKFYGPFTGMGISGFNDLGTGSVSTPMTCASLCRSDDRCRSFDYGARGDVLGECWLSTATRESAGASYTSWPLYDYYELIKTMESESDSTEMWTPGDKMTSDSTDAASRAPKTSASVRASVFWMLCVYYMYCRPVC